MKIKKIIMGLSLLLTTGYVYAERMAQCKKYWNEVAVQVKVLEDTECPSIWGK